MSANASELPNRFAASQKFSDVHVMPREYWSEDKRKKHASVSHQAPKQQSKIPTWLVVVLLVVGALVTILVAIFVLRNVLSNSDSTNTSPIVGDFNVNVSNQNTNTNTNQNTNLNANTNTNTNVPANTNINSNTNSNTNTNTNLNTNASNTNTNTNQSTPIDRVPLPPSSLDSDDDDITDKEEGVFQTTKTKPDSDTDGYYDGEELHNLYDPTVAGGKLLGSVIVKEYRNIQQDYAILYPAAFVVGETTPTKEELLFTADTGEFIGVSVSPVTSGISTKEWYAEQLGGFVDPDDLATTVIGGEDGVMGVDDRNAYVIRNNLVYILQYNIGIRKEMNFYTTFEMMLASFRFTD
ncbi:MAG: hypothetical protein HYZ08_00520 [Candidatus Kerfeldbacteria bacterium]|nr:hypothetical protein [Candidatus Kerfeldbacteria bacterium]